MTEEDRSVDCGFHMQGHTHKHEHVCTAHTTHMHTHVYACMQTLSLCTKNLNDFLMRPSVHMTMMEVQFSQL